MAKRLDWTKARADTIKGERMASQIQEVDSRQDKYYKYKNDVETQKKLLEQGIWPTGKHAGKKLSELSENYLVWAGLKLKSKHMKYAANNELLRRYNTGQIKL